MHVHCTFWPASGAAGEVQQRQVLWPRSGKPRLRTGLRHCRIEVDCAVEGLGSAAVDQQHMLEPGKLTAPFGNLAAVEGGSGHKDLCLTDRHPGAHRFWAEGREQRREHAAIAQCPQCRSVEFGYSTEQAEHPIAVADTQSSRRLAKRQLSSKSSR